MGLDSFCEDALPWPGDQKGSPLCHVCKSLVRRSSKVRQRPWAKESAEDLENRTVEDVEHSAKRGCHLCHVLTRSLSDHDRKLIAEHNKRIENYNRMELRSYYNPSRQSRQLKKFYIKYGSVANAISRCFHIADVPLTTDRPLNFRDLLNAFENTNQNQRCFALMRQWIRTCEETHPMCQQAASKAPNENKRHPSRLLYVGENTASQLHLRLGTSLSSNEHYLTLSHRWGAEMPLRLMTCNLGAFMDDIPIENLPNTFKDAVTITRELGVQYLWVDSLCIIQDSREDWQRESVQMASIYENAWCNVAATKAIDSNGGCFTTRRPADVIPCFLDLNIEDQQGNLRSNNTLSFVYPETLWDEGVERFELFSRGWVVQERLLAPRILHFSKYQVYWECVTLRACETFPHGIQAPGLPSNEVRSPSTFTRQPNLRAFLGSHAPDRNMIWTTLVEYYCRCELSVPDKDKLVAVSGVARRLGAAENYLAGVWLDALPRQLMWAPVTTEWKPQSDRTPFVRSIQYRAPSWSWASCDGPIQFKNKDSTTLLIEIISADIIPVVDSDRFGQVSGGHIQLEGRLEKVRIRSSLFDEGHNAHERNGHWATMYLLVMSNQPNWSRLVLELTRIAPGQYVRRGFLDSKPLENSHCNWSFPSPLDENEYEADLGVDELSGGQRYRITIV